MDGQPEADIVAQYAEGPARLEASIAGLDDSALDLAPDAVNWSIRQIVHHVADGDEVWRAFLKRAIARPQGDFHLEWYWCMPQTDWARAWRYPERDVRASLEVLRANRRQMVELLRLAPDALENALRVRWSSGEEQRITVHWVVESQARHVVGHVEDIRRIREAHGV